LSLVQRTERRRAWTRAVSPFCTMADALAGELRQNRFGHDDGDLADEALDAQVIAKHMPAVCNGSRLKPVYDTRAAGWLLDQSARKTRYGDFRARAVFDGRRELVGWYAHYVRKDAISEVVQLAARNGGYESVLQKLLADGWRCGAVAVRGRMDPHYVQQ